MGRSKGAYHAALIGFILLPFVLYSLIAVCSLTALKKFCMSKRTKKSPQCKTLDIENKVDKSYESSNSFNTEMKIVKHPDYREKQQNFQ